MSELCTMMLAVSLTYRHIMRISFAKKESNVLYLTVIFLFSLRYLITETIVPLLSTHQNNRDHRKIMVIDGATAFCGGINISDEYINEKQRFGYWKDNGVRITGKAVYSMTQMFLQMWNAFALEKDKLDYEKFCLEDVRPLAKEERGIVLPYSDHPLDSECTEVYIFLYAVSDY